MTSSILSDELTAAGTGSAAWRAAPVMSVPAQTAQAADPPEQPARPDLPEAASAPRPHWFWSPGQALLRRFDLRSQALGLAMCGMLPIALLAALVLGKAYFDGPLGARPLQGLAALRQLLLQSAPLTLHLSDLLLVAAALALWLLATLYLLACAGQRLSTSLHRLQAQAGALQAGGEDAPAPRGGDELERAGQLLGAAICRLQRQRDVLALAAAGVQQGAQAVADEQIALVLRAGEIRGAFAELPRRTLAFTALMDDCSQGVEAALAEVQAWHDEQHHAAQALSSLRSRLLGLNGLGREIGHVVQNIEVVAQQTRLLALNALVEAEPLGAGAKGFVVVVQELRALAQRNEDAARTLRQVIAAALVEIETGHQASERVSQAGDDSARRIDAVQQVLADMAGHAEHGDRDARQLIELNSDMAIDIDGLAQRVERLARALTALRCQGHALQAALRPLQAG